VPLHNPSELASGAVRGVRSRSLARAPRLSASCGGWGGRIPLTRVHHGRMAPRSEDERATSMPLASRAECEGINSLIFNRMCTLSLWHLLARDEHLDESQDVSFTR